MSGGSTIIRPATPRGPRGSGLLSRMRVIRAISSRQANRGRMSGGGNAWQVAARHAGLGFGRHRGRAGRRGLRLSGRAARVAAPCTPASAHSASASTAAQRRYVISTWE